MLLNTGFDPVPSKHGLLTTIGYKLSPEATLIVDVSKPLFASDSLLQSCSLHGNMMKNDEIRIYFELCCAGQTDLCAGRQCGMCWASGTVAA